MEVGFAGLGHMGQPMAMNLLKAGHRLVVWNRTPSKAELLAENGAEVAAAPTELARTELIITMLSDDDAVTDLMFERGVLAALPQASIHVSMSTISVALSDRLAEAHRTAKQLYIAAPVFGRPEAARARALYIVAAGADPTIMHCQPLFDAMAQKTFVAGERPSMANVVKLAGNFMIASMLESLGETFALVRKSGIDPHRYLDILTGSLFSAPVYRIYGQLIAESNFEPAGFRMSLALKDMRLALAAADARMVPMPAASLVRDHLVSGVAQGQGDVDWSGLAGICAKEAGL
jgi:3-hydroxyisobutyrate dehydrogenase-like beta-hydroxyacid dehydrogenase